MTKFIVSLRKADGSFDEVGMNNRYITTGYKTLSGLVRHGISKVGKDRGYRVYNDNGRILASNC
jgi:hypothetical protein